MNNIKGIYKRFCVGFGFVGGGILLAAYLFFALSDMTSNPIIVGVIALVVIVLVLLEYRNAMNAIDNEWTELDAASKDIAKDITKKYILKCGVGVTALLYVLYLVCIMPIFSASSGGAQFILVAAIICIAVIWGVHKEYVKTLSKLNEITA